MDRVLVHDDPKKELILTCDGSEKTVAYAPRTLTTAKKKKKKKNYYQLDEEGLGIIFGLK